MSDAREQQSPPDAGVPEGHRPAAEPPVADAPGTPPGDHPPADASGDHPPATGARSDPARGSGGGPAAGATASGTAEGQHGGTPLATDEAPGDGEQPLGPRMRRRQDERRRGKGSFLAELPVLVLIAFVLALLLKTFLVQAFYIPSESMLPTLAVGDRVLVNKLAHQFREPERGEVIVFSQEDGLPGADPSANPVMRAFQSLASGLGFVQTGEKDFIKRIVGLPGETIEMREGVVYVDGETVPEAPESEGGYLSRPDLVDFGPVEIPPDEYFLMGDNRPNSSDSRSLLSTIHADDIVGRAFAVVWPVGRLSILSMPDYDDAVSADPPSVAAAAEPPAGVAAGAARRAPADE